MHAGVGRIAHELIDRAAVLDKIQVAMGIDH